MRRIRIVSAFSAALALAGVALVAPTAAIAADGVANDISSDIVRGTTVTHLGDDPDTTRWFDSLLVEFELRTTGAVDAGDWFTVSFSNDISVPDTTLELHGDPPAPGEPAPLLANCVATNSTGTITCTLTEYAATREFVAGSLEATVQVSNQADGDNFEITVGTEVIVTPWPGGPVQPNLRPPFPNGEITKWGWQWAEYPNQLIWTVNIPSGISGQGQPIVVDDTLNGASTWVGAPYIQIRSYLNNDAWVADAGTTVEVGPGTQTLQLVPGIWSEVTLTEVDGTHFTLHIEDNIPTGGLYQVVYNSRVADQILSGQVIQNVATVNGTAVEKSVAYVDRLSGNLNGPGFGGFVVSKFTGGPGATLAAGRQFTVVASWTGADGAPHTQNLVVTAGGLGAQLNGLPTGTLVTLTEITTTQIPGVASYTPVFSSDDDAVQILNGGQSAQFVIRDAQSISVAVTNIVTPVQPEISIIKVDGDGNDANTTAESVDLTAANGSTDLTFTIENTGDEDLTSLVVRDVVAHGGTVTNLQCVFPGSTTPVAANAQNVVTAPADAILVVDSTFECTATLTGVSSDTAHLNTARVDGVGVGSGIPVTDDDPYNAHVTGSVSVGDYVWHDVNRDGLQDDTDVPLEGVTLTLTGPDGDVTDVYGNHVTPTTTDEHGYYEFTGLPILTDGQHYTVTVTDPAGFIPTLEGVGEPDEDSSTGFAESTGLTANGDHDPTLDFGFVTPMVSVGDYVWHDVNRDGLQDDTDVPLEGVTLTLTGPDGGDVTDVYGNPVTPTTTDEHGYYEFTGLPALTDGQHYTVTVTPPAGYLATLEHAGPSDVDSSTLFATSTELTEDGQHDGTLDFGFVTPEPVVTPPPAPGLPTTGVQLPWWLILVGLGAVLAGGTAAVARSRGRA